MKTSVELKKGKVRWFYHIKAANGKILNSSQKYFSKGNAKRAATATARILGVEVKEV